MTGRRATGLVTRREVRERVRQKSFLVSTGINVAIVIGVILIGTLLGGGDDSYVVGVTDAEGRAVAEAAGPDVEVRPVDPAAARSGLADGSLDVVLSEGELRAQEDPEDELVTLLQGANRQVSAAAALEEAGVSDPQRVLQPAPLEVTTVEPVDDDADAKAALTFFIVIILYGQLLTYGYWVAAGVVEEKSSRVVEVVLSTIRPAHLLAGKVIGLGLLGLANLLLVGAVGLLVAGATGALEVDADVLTSVALALAWFVVGYAFYACAFAVAGALVPRQEELQSTTTPLTLVILASFFLAFAVQSDPDGTLAVVTTFLPMTAPMTMPPRIIGGDAATWEIIASFVVTIGASVALIPLAARIYAGGVMRTGSSVKLREAWRAARA